METKILILFSFCRPRSARRYSDLATWGALPVIQEYEGTTFVRLRWCFFPATNQADKQVLFLAGACGCPLKICDIENWLLGWGKEWLKEEVSERYVCTQEYSPTPHPAPRSPPLQKVCRIKRALFWGREGRVKRNCKNEVERIGRLRDLRYRNCSHKTPLISSYWHFYTWQNCSTPLPAPRNHQSYMSFVDQDYVTSGPFLLCQRLLLLNAVVALIFDAFEHTLCKHCTKSSIMKINYFCFYLA